MGKAKGYINHGIYADLIHQYVEYKRSLGFKIEDTEERLQRFDRMTVERKENRIGITKSLFEEWSKIAPLESIANNYGRISMLRGFSAYLQLLGYISYIPKLPRYKSTFMPHIYTKQEMANLFRECDKLYCHRRYLYSSKCVYPEKINRNNDIFNCLFCICHRAVELHILSLFRLINTLSMERINEAILLREILPEA